MVEKRALLVQGARTCTSLGSSGGPCPWLRTCHSQGKHRRIFTHEMLRSRPAAARFEIQPRQRWKFEVLRPDGSNSLPNPKTAISKPLWSLSYFHRCRHASKHTRACPAKRTVTSFLVASCVTQRIVSRTPKRLNESLPCLLEELVAQAQQHKENNEQAPWNSMFTRGLSFGKR